MLKPCCELSARDTSDVVVPPANKLLVGANYLSPALADVRRSLRRASCNASAGFTARGPLLTCAR